MKYQGNALGGQGLGIGQLNPASALNHGEPAKQSSAVFEALEVMDKTIARLGDAVEMLDRRTEPVRLITPQTENASGAIDSAGCTLEYAIADRYRRIDLMGDRLQAILRELRI